LYGRRCQQAHRARPGDSSPSEALDLSGADLRGLSLREIYFGAAKLRGADLREADLSGGWLRGADLSEADLRRANLSGVQFEKVKLGRARVEGAAFEFATFWSTAFTRQQVAHGGRLGAAARRLEEAEARMEWFTVAGEIEWGQQLVKFSVRTDRPVPTGRPVRRAAVVWATGEHFQQGYADRLAGGLLILANTWGGGRPKLDSLQVKGKGGTLKAKALREAVRAALGEVFGV
jgi:hypothetical protein